MIIAFMGNDGSGKTTIANSITQLVRECGFKSSYKHEYEYALLKVLFKVVGKERLSKSRKELLVERKKSMTYQVWPALVWFDTLLQFLYYRVFKKNEIIVLDRYAYDQYLSYTYLGNLTCLTKWLFLHFPRPDAAIVLAVAPEVAFERKKNTHDYPLVFYERQTKQYLRIAEELNLPLVRTDNTFSETLSQVAALLFENKRTGKALFRKAIQNRVLMPIAMKYSLKLPSKVVQNHQKRKEMFSQSMKSAKRILEDCNINGYTLIKTRVEHGFIGNDTDILVVQSDFATLKNTIERNQESYKVDRINFDVRKDSGKMDLFIRDSLKIDVHSYVGWRNLQFLHYDQLEDFIRTKSIFGVECKTLDERANSFLVILTIFFDKGFITMDDYHFLIDNLIDLEFSDFENYRQLLRHCRLWLQDILNEQPAGFPVFVPLSTLTRGYYELLNSRAVRGTRMTKIGSMVKTLSLMAFWRLRYRVNGKLPFEVPLD